MKYIYNPLTYNIRGERVRDKEETDLQNRESEIVREGEIGEAERERKR